MSKVIRQSVELPAAAGRLFDAYMNPRTHGAIIGSRVAISRRPASPFSAFNGGVRGKTLLVVPRRMIVQSWRGNRWGAADLDSILILTFSDGRRGGRIDLVQAAVPDRQYTLIRDGWRRYYWTPWRAFLREQTGRRRFRR